MTVRRATMMRPNFQLESFWISFRASVLMITVWWRHCVFCPVSVHIFVRHILMNTMSLKTSKFLQILHKHPHGWIYSFGQNQNTHNIHMHSTKLLFLWNYVEIQRTIQIKKQQQLQLQQVQSSMKRRLGWVTLFGPVVQFLMAYAILKHPHLKIVCGNFANHYICYLLFDSFTWVGITGCWVLNDL